MEKIEDMENRNNHKNQKTVKTDKAVKTASAIFSESLKSLKSLMQIFVESAKSAKSIFATFASANFAGKASCGSTMRYGVRYKIPSFLFRYSLDPHLSRSRSACAPRTPSLFKDKSQLSFPSLASLICLCMLTVGVGNAWGTDVVFTFNTTAGLTELGITEPSKNSTTEITSDISKSVITIEPAKNNASSKPVVRKSDDATPTMDLRLYKRSDGTKGASITIKVSGDNKLTGISGLWTSKVAASNGTLSSGSWTPTQNSTTTEVEIYNSSTAKSGTASGCTVITVSYESTVSCTSITPSLSYASVGGTTLVVGSTSSGSPTVSGNTGSGAVTYSVTAASPAGCATVDSSTGVVTAVAAGTATITASIAANGGYCSGSATANFTITVPAYTVQFSTGTGNPTVSSRTEASGGAGITLPAGPIPTCSGDGWSFAGWKESSAQSSAALPGTKLWQAGETYSPASDITLYAVYFQASGNNYKYIENLNSLFDGAKMIITAYNSGEYAVSNTTDGDGYINSSSVSPDGDDVISSPANSIVWTLKGYKDNWTLKNVENNKYIIVSTLPALAVDAETVSITYEIDEDDYDQFNIQKGSKYLTIWDDNTLSGYDEKNYLYFYQQQGIYNSNPTCCTPLGSINGSVSFSNVSPTSVTVGVPSDYVDKDNANLEGYIFKRYTASTGGSAVETIETDDPSGTTATFNTGLVANTAYYYTIIAKHSSSSCNSEETSPRKSHTIPSYIVSYAAGDGSGSNPGAHDPVLSGTSVTLKGNTFTAPTGKEFAGWNDGSNDYSVGASYSVTGNKTMTAQWSCITPSISCHPSSASYTQGASPANLSVTASGGTLSYQWKQCATIDGTYVNVASGGTSSTYSPSTASVGTTYYKCVVTNTGSSCNTFYTSNVATITISEASQCVAPTFSVAAGTYNSAQTVTISSTTPGSTIYYTTNGDEPTTSSSHGTEGEASASVTVSSSLTLKAKAFKDGLTASEVSDAAYVICSTDPSFSTTSSSNITITGARVTCAGITKGTCDVDAYGIVYGTSEHPTGNAQQKGTDASTNVSSYYVDLTGLTAATTYYARPYATVNGKTVYGTEISFTTLHIPEITVSETSHAFGTKKVDGSYEMSFTVSGAYLQSNIGLAINGTNEAMFSVDKTSLTPSTGTVGSTTVTVTYTPSAAGSHSATVSITSTNATTKTVTLSGTGQYEDTYMTAMHEGVDAWTSYATGVTQAGTGYDVPNPGDIAAGDREGTGCEGIHYHFAGWVEETYKASPSGHIVAASGTKDASNKTFWAVWEKEAAGSVDGYLLVEDHTILSAGDKILIANAKASSASVLGFQRVDKSSNQTNRGCVSSVTITSKVINPSIASSNSETSKAFEIELQETSSGWYLYDVANSGYLQANGGTSNNYLTYHSGSDHDNHDTWTISVDAETGRATIMTLAGTTSSNKGWMRWNNTSSLFSCYNSGQSDIYVFKYAKEYEDPKVECICSADPVAGTAAVDAEGTFSASSIAVKATGASTGHADCSYTDYGFVWSSSVTTPTLVEGTGAASDNCTKIQVDDEGEVTSFTGSITGSFTANNPIYVRSYVKNGKAEGTYQYSSVVTITPRSVTFNLNGHGSSAPAAQFVNNGSKATDPSYTESVTGYIFGGWYKEVGCTNQWNFATDIVSGESKTLYAKWTPISYSVRFNDNDENYLGTATGSMDNESYNYDENKALTANGFSLAGYDFAGWATTPTGDVAHLDKAEVENLSSTNGATVDLYAIWSPKTYDVTLAATDETSSVGDQVVTATYNVAMPTTKQGGGDVVAPSRTGYTFTGWEYSSTTYYNYDAGTSTLSSAHVWDQPNSTTTLTPKWSINSYTLTWNLAGGTVSVAGTGAEEGATGTPSSSVVYNSAITFPTVTRAGYNFAGWDVTPARNMPASNVTHTATWTAKALNNISLEEASISVYVGEIKYVNVIFDPTDILSKAFSQAATPSYCQLSSYSSYNQLKITGGRAGADVSVDRTETVSIKYTADETKTASITVTVKPLPTVTFVDLIHNKSDFANSGDGWTAGTGILSSTVTTGVVSHAKKTPTHTDVSAPVGGNACETGHLHLMGWIRSDYSKVADYMNGTGEAPSVSDLTTAGAEYWFLPDADINTETYNGKTFYAVWAVEE